MKAWVTLSSISHSLINDFEHVNILHSSIRRDEHIPT